MRIMSSLLVENVAENELPRRMLMVLNALEAVEKKLEAAEKAAQTYRTYEDLFKTPEEPGQE